MTIYRIEFLPAAKKEWDKLDHALRRQLDKKLAEVAKNPHIISARMRGHPNAYRLKARSAGYRLIYRVQDSIITVFIVAVGRRERGEAFEIGLKRLKEFFGDD